jgi:hypothetical protein
MIVCAIRNTHNPVGADVGIGPYGTTLTNHVNSFSLFPEKIPPATGQEGLHDYTRLVPQPEQKLSSSRKALPQMGQNLGSSEFAGSVGCTGCATTGALAAGALMA